MRRPWGLFDLRFSTCTLLVPCSLVTSLLRSFLHNVAAHDSLYIPCIALPSGIPHTGRLHPIYELITIIFVTIYVRERDCSMILICM